jgi:uncharacterized alpha-E superfamily protein
MLSRVAESIYWMNRYIERAENNARFLDVNFNLVLDMPTGFAEQWQPLLRTTASEGLFGELYGEASRSNVIEFIGFDRRNPSSIYNCIAQARENARAIRENLTKESWEQINDLYLTVKKGVEDNIGRKKDPRQFFDRIKKGCQLLYGITDSTVSRTEAWHFGRIGQMLERADNISRVLDVKYHILLPTVAAVGTTVDIIQWAALLRSVSAYNMYRRRHGKILPFSIARFLLLDDQFPRSVFFSIVKAEESLRQIAGGEQSGYRHRAEQYLGKLRSELEYADMNDIFATGLHEYLDDMQRKLIAVANALQEVYFSYNLKSTP